MEGHVVRTEADEVTIRPATADDAPALVPLVTELGYPAHADAIAARLGRLVSFGGPAVAIVAADRGNRVLGLVTGHAIQSVHDDAPVAWLTTLVVSSAARGRGVGRQLVRAVEAWATTHGAVRVSLTSATHRDDARQFYEALGYAVTGRRFTRPLGAGTQGSDSPGTHSS